MVCNKDKRYVIVGGKKIDWADERTVRTLKFNGDKNTIMRGISPHKEFRKIVIDYFKSYGHKKLVKRNKSGKPCTYIDGTNMRLYWNNRDFNFCERLHIHQLILKDIENEIKNFIIRRENGKTKVINTGWD